MHFNLKEFSVMSGALVAPIVIKKIADWGNKKFAELDEDAEDVVVNALNALHSGDKQLTGDVIRHFISNLHPRVYKKFRNLKSIKVRNSTDLWNFYVMLLENIEKGDDEALDMFIQMTNVIVKWNCMFLNLMT